MFGLRKLGPQNPMPPEDAGAWALIFLFCVALVKAWINYAVACVGR